MDGQSLVNKQKSKGKVKGDTCHHFKGDAWKKPYDCTGNMAFLVGKMTRHCIILKSIESICALD
jgi:hypothetical protein